MTRLRIGRLRLGRTGPCWLRALVVLLAAVLLAPNEIRAQEPGAPESEEPRAEAGEPRAEAGDSAVVEPGARRDTILLPPLRAAVRRSLFDPGLARSFERLEPARELFPFHDLADWLASRASVAVRGYGGGGRQVLSVRGGRPEGVLVLLDGLPLNDPLTGEADLSTVALSSLESATLVRGAGAARYGSGALGGALLLETAGAERREPAARLGVGSHGAYDASGSAGWSRGSSGVVVGAGLRGADNDFMYENRLAGAAPRQRRENADSEQRWMNVAGEAGDVRATLRYDDLERGVPGRLGTTAFAGDRWDETRWSLTGGAAGEDASLRGGFRRMSMRYTPGGVGEGTRQRAIDARLGGEVALAEPLDVVVAGRLSVEQLEGDGIAGAPERLAAGATVRKSFGIGGDAGEGAGLEPLVAVDVSDDGTAVSPELGAWFRPGESLRLYGRIGRGYRLPTFADLHFEAAPGIRANADLEAERVVLDGELGLEASRPVGEGTASMRLAVWNRDTRRPIVWLASSAAIWSPRNLDRLAARGVDFEGRLESDPDDAAGWGVEAGLSLQRSRVGFGTNRNPLPYQPDVTGRASAELRAGATAARVEAAYTGSRTTSLAATRRLEGFLTLDVSLRHRLAPGPFVVEATLDVENLFDHRYELVELFPEPGRTVRLTLDIH